MLWLALQPSTKWPYGLAPTSSSGATLCKEMCAYVLHVTPSDVAHYRADLEFAALPGVDGHAGDCQACGSLVLRRELHEPSCSVKRIDAKTQEEILLGAYCNQCAETYRVHSYIVDRVRLLDQIRVTKGRKKNQRVQQAKETNQ